MTWGVERRPISSADVGRLVLGPLVYAAGIAVWWISDRLVVVGPFDRAQIGWALVVPALALAPGLAGLPEAMPHLARASRRVALATSAATGLAVASWITANTAQVGCRPVTSPLEVVGQAILTGALSGLAFLGGYVVSAAQASGDHRLGGVIAGSVTWLVIAAATFIVFAMVLFPPLSCPAPSM